MKKILYLRTDITDCELVAGGSVTHTVGVVKGFLELGYEVVCASSVMLATLEKLNLSSVYVLKNPFWLCILRWKLNCVLSNFFFTIRIVRIIKQERKQKPIECIYQRYSFLNCSGILASMLTGVPLVLEYNGSEVWLNNHWGKKNWFMLHNLSRRVELFNLQNAQHIVVVSNALHDELVERGINTAKILVNSNGVDSTVFNPTVLASVRQSIRTQLQLEKRFVFGFIGTFSQWHGIDLLAQALPRIIERQPRCHFLLIGDGPLLSGLQSSIETLKNEAYVTCTGLLKAHKAKEYLSACDAFLSPTQPNADGSRFFGSPTKLFEYMSMAKPIIATDLEQLSELINPAFKLDDFNMVTYSRACGILIQPNNVEQLVNAACLLMGFDKKILKAIGDNARKKVIKNYTWVEHVKKIEQFACLINDVRQ